MAWRMNWALLIAIIIPTIGGSIIGEVFVKKNMAWYESLKKPKYNPPKWAFAFVWTALYCAMGHASYLVWRDGGGFEGAALPLSVYGVNLALNWLWTPLFFGMHQLKWSLYEVVMLDASTAALGIVFYPVNSVAGYIIIPYFVWVCYATLLNYAIYRNNKDLPEKIKNDN
nr:PREDICTED: translocator protein-like [Linepithema humile]